jgi:uncharacterized protein (DUF302 family)
MTNVQFTAETHSMTRLDIATGVAYDDFRAAFERAAPPFDVFGVYRLVADGANWDDVRAAAADNAPNGMMIFASIDATPLTALAGNHVKAVEYLLGNHVVAERMFRHEPKALLYAPLRILIHSDADDTAVFTLDQPSTAFAGLGIPQVAAVGQELDRKVAALLRVIGVDADDAFGVHQ